MVNVAQEFKKLPEDARLWVIETMRANFEEAEMESTRFPYSVDRCNKWKSREKAFKLLYGFLLRPSGNTSKMKKRKRKGKKKI